MTRKGDDKSSRRRLDPPTDIDTDRALKRPRRENLSTLGSSSSSSSSPSPLSSVPSSSERSKSPTDSAFLQTSTITTRKDRASRRVRELVRNDSNENNLESTTSLLVSSSSSSLDQVNVESHSRPREDSERVDRHITTRSDRQQRSIDGEAQDERRDPLRDREGDDRDPDGLRDAQLDVEMEETGNAGNDVTTVSRDGQTWRAALEPVRGRIVQLARQNIATFARTLEREIGGVIQIANESDNSDRAVEELSNEVVRMVESAAEDYSELVALPFHSRRQVTVSRRGQPGVHVSGSGSALTTAIGAIVGTAMSGNTLSQLRSACTEGNTDFVRRSLSSHYIRDTLLNSRDYVSLISTARQNLHDDVVLELVRALMPNHHENLAIRLAAKFGLTDVVRDLLAMPQVEPQAVDDAAIILACEFGNTQVVRLLLDDGRVNPAARNDCPLRWGAQHGNLEIVNMLLEDPRVDPSACENFAIRQASIRGHADVVARLLEYPMVDPRAKENRAIRLAAANGHTAVVNLLLQDSRCDPSARENVALIRAAKNGFEKVVELLLQDSRVDPSISSNMALMKAAKHDRTEVLRVMLRDPRIKPASQQCRALAEAFSRGNMASVKLLVCRKDVQRAANNHFSEGQLLTLQMEYQKLMVKSFRAGRYIVKWSERLTQEAEEEQSRGQTTNDDALCERLDIMAKIAALAFGKELVISHSSGDTHDSFTQTRAESLVKRLLSYKNNDE